MTGMRLLSLDIETSAAEFWGYGMFNQNFALKQIKTPPYILGWATHWYGEPLKTTTYTWADEDGAYETLWRQLDQATHVLHFNGRTFDMPWINHEFKKRGVNGDGRPPSPYKQVDLLAQTRSQMRSLSNKLQFLSTDLLGLEGKIEANALDLFIQMQSDDPKTVERARAKMERYCVQDVRLLPKFFDLMLPWLKGINANLYNPEPDSQACPNCGRERLVRRGLAYTAQGAYQRFRCSACGTWSRATKRSTGVSVVNAR